MGAIAAFLTLLHGPLHANAPQPSFSLYPSQYASTVAAPFNQPDYYPIAAQPAPSYRPLGDWVGRLILPSAEDYQQTTAATQETDWAWLEVHLAPAEYRAWVGQTVRLAWQPTPLAQAYVSKASRDVRFAPAVQKTLEKGVIHPIRLNGRDRVGPLQSLAGGHPYDDVTVVLRGTVTPEGQPGTSPTLRVVREPVQETGRYVGLVKFKAVDWLIMLTVLLAFGVVAIALTRFIQNASSSYAVSHLLTWQPASLPWYRVLLSLISFLLLPAFLEEYLFRVLLIPDPKPWIPEWNWWSWALLALGAYVLYRWLRLRMAKQHDSAAPLRLTLSVLLGLASILTYRLTGSAWTIIALHWIAVSVWWLLLGGWQQTQPAFSRAKS
ncbi:MAG: hypothetical protein OHK0037_24300 [Elainellaceae cyanobacterium]